MPARPPQWTNASLPAAPLPAGDLFGHAAARPTPRKRTTATASGVNSTVPHARDWGPVAELDYETPSADEQGTASEPEATHAGVYEPWHPRTARIPGACEHPTPLVQSAAMAAVPHPVPAYRPMLPVRIVTDELLSDAQLESVILAGQAHDRHLSALYRIGEGWETVARVADNEDDNGDDGNNVPETANKADKGEALSAGLEPATDATGDGEALSAPVRFRRGWMLGDGTGCGKGRQVAAIILDHWLRGRRRALWLSASDKLLEDARRDWAAIGGSEADIIPLGKFRQGADIPQEAGILFATYATLRSPARQGKRSRLDQIVGWLADGLDEDSRHAYGGVIVFDEAHAMANAAGSKGSRGDTAPSQQGRAGLRLQNALPDARILYVSATGATTVPGLAYACRLGLWGGADSGGETPFEQRTDFVTAMEAGGVAAMEVVARDLKALGLYQARALSYDGVEVEPLEHPLTPEQRRIYDAYAGAFKVIHRNIEDALKAGREYVDVRALLLDPVDLRGIPWRDGADRTRWAPPAFLPPSDADGSWLINLEELPSALPMVQAALYQLVLDRKCGEYELPEGAALIACGNREGDRGVVQAIQHVVGSQVPGDVDRQALPGPLVDDRQHAERPAIVWCGP